MLGVLKQIKKISKIAKNLTKTNTKLPQFVIGIMCSFGKESVEQQFQTINEKKVNSELTLFQYINKVIEDNGIKYVLAVIKEEKIGEYNLGKEDSLDRKHKRVDITLMNEKLDFKLTSKEIELLQKEIKYESINYEEKMEISFNEYEEIKKQNQERLQLIQEQNQKVLQLQEQNQKLQEQNQKQNLERFQLIQELQEQNQKLQEQNQK